MAMMSTGNSSSRSYSYTRSVSYTFEEAISKAIDGSLDPSLIYDQGQSQLKEFLDSISKQKFSKQFTELTKPNQRKVLKALLSEIEREKEQSKKPTTLLDVLNMAMKDEIDHNKLFEVFPEKYRKVLDEMGKMVASTNFLDATLEQRKKIISILIESVNSQQDSVIKKLYDQGLAYHNNALIEYEKGNKQDAITLMHESANFSKKYIEAIKNNINDKLYYAVACNLSSAYINLGDWENNPDYNENGLSISKQALENMNENLKNTSNYGILNNNYGESLYKKGVLLRNKDLVEQGIEKLNIALQHFQTMNNEEAVKEVSNTISQAKHSIEKENLKEKKT
ncbi:MAG: hypothetical protein K8S18_16655 [Desulfobacula sp.]|nr:hypothetical protein [Desulfobacula sp.]